VEFGQVASIASGKPVRPSQQTISTSLIPRLASSAHTPAQNLAPSAVWTQIPSTCSGAVHIHSDGDVGGLVAHLSAIFDLDY
jgi:hypothetical protein